MSVITSLEKLYYSNSVQLILSVLKQLSDLILRMVKHLSNDYVLNVSIHFQLLLFISVILINIIVEMTVVPHREYRSFLIWALSFFVRVCVCITMLVTAKNMPDSGILFWLQIVSFGISLVIHIFMGDWFLQYLTTKCHVPEWLFHLYPGIVAAFLTAAELLSNKFNSVDYRFIGQEFVYLLDFILVMIYRKTVELSLAAILLFGVSAAAVTCAQTLWPYTPVNIFGTVFLLVIYLRIWQRRQISMLETQRSLDSTTAELNESRRINMMNQIQPHFVYNTLSTIASLCETNPEQAQLVTEQFSDYLRENIHFGSMKALCPFPEELEHIRTYLSIEHVRFGERLNVKYDLEETDFLIPALSVQPIVENAVKHGIMQKAGGGTVIISTRTKGDYVVLTIVDNGVGFDTNTVHKGIGLKYAGESIKAMLHTDMLVESVLGESTTVTILVKREK